MNEDSYEQYQNVVNITGRTLDYCALYVTRCRQPHLPLSIVVIEQELSEKIQSDRIELASIRVAAPMSVVLSIRGPL